MLKKLVALVLLNLSVATAVNATSINFDEFSAGSIITGLNISGATFSVENQGNNRELMIFDANCNGLASNCSGGDQDLFFMGLGSVLIISEDNDSTDPDDSRFGGDIVLSFDNPVNNIFVTALDVENGGPNANFVEAFLDGSSVLKMFIFSLDNQLTSALFPSDLLADQLIISFAGSGAVGEIKFNAVPVPASIFLFSGSLLALIGFLKNKRH